jgi:hypothetical protein
MEQCLCCTPTIENAKAKFENKTRDDLLNVIIGYQKEYNKSKDKIIELTADAEHFKENFIFEKSNTDNYFNRYFDKFFELANTENELANIKAELANTKAELANTKAELANIKQYRLYAVYRRLTSVFRRR